MVQQRNYVLRSAVAACFGVAAGHAYAILDLTPSTPTGTAKFAKEIPSDTTTLTNAGNALDIKVAVPPGYTVASGNPLFIKFDLTSAAKFGATPTLSCLTGAGADSAAGNLTQGASTNALTFSVPNGAVVDGTCTLTAGNITISGLSNVNVSATVEYKNGLQDAVTGVAATYISYVRGVSADILPADGNVVVDATSGSDNFDSTKSNRSSESLATLGSVTFGSNGKVAADAAGVQTTAGSVSAGSVITTAYVTVSGPAVGAALAANGNSGIFLDAAASACTTKSYKASDSAANSVTFNNVTPADISAGLNVCINVSGGMTVIGIGQMTASIDGKAVSKVTVDFSSASDKLEDITSNGSVKNAYLINASTSPAKTSVLRVINTGVVAAEFTATAYEVDVGMLDGTPVTGAQLGTANSSLGTVVPGGSLSLTSAQLEAALGFTPSASGSKYRLVISAGTNDMVVLNYTKDVATGAIVLAQ